MKKFYRIRFVFFSEKKYRNVESSHGLGTSLIDFLLSTFILNFTLYCVWTFYTRSVEDKGVESGRKVKCEHLLENHGFLRL